MGLEAALENAVVWVMCGLTGVWKLVCRLVDYQGTHIMKQDSLPRKCSEEEHAPVQLCLWPFLPTSPNPSAPVRLTPKPSPASCITQVGLWGLGPVRGRPVLFNHSQLPNYFFS